MSDESKCGLRSYEVVYIVILLVFACLGIFYVTKPRVGIIDVARVAQELGVDEQMTADARQLESDAMEQAQQLRVSFSEREKILRDKLSSTTSEDEKAEILKELGNMAATLRRQTNEIRVNLSRQRQNAASDFLTELQPYINEVAKTRNMRVVLERRGSVLYAISKVDITDQVVKLAKPAFQSDVPEAVNPTP